MTPTKAACLATVLAVGACAPTPRPATSGATLVLAGARIAGGPPVDVVITDGVVTEVVGARDEQPEDARVIDLSGRWLAPAFIDSHVHIVLDPRAAEMARGGVAAVVDHAAPERVFAESEHPRVLAAGPILTAPGGYPTRSWGKDGYGRECASRDEAVAAVVALHARGARLIKLAFADGPRLDDATARAVVARAHQLELRVSCHALAAEAARIAYDVGCDVLAHTPTERLDEALLDDWSSRAVITTLRAFGSGDDAIANLGDLHRRGATVLYGTDFGNATVAGINGMELRAMTAAGLDPGAILSAATATPAAYWGRDELGAIATGRAASLLVLEADPLLDPLTLARPLQVWLGGERVTP